MNKTIVQVSIIVKDVERTAAHYREILGFNMPTDFPSSQLHDHARIICFDVGRIQLEFLQPLDAPSTWKEFLDQHGEGIHHIAFLVSKTADTVETFAAHGYRVTQQGLFTGQTGMYTYLDTDKDLGIVIELLEHFSGNPVIQSPIFPADKGIGTDIVCQVGIIVRDIEQTAARYNQVLGLSKPQILQVPNYEITKTTYKAQPCDATARLAFFDLGQIQLELIEPDEKSSVWRDFLETRGDGAHHIAFQVKDTQRVTDYLAHHNIAIEQQGLYADSSGMYTYLASEALLGTSIELLESF